MNQHEINETIFHFLIQHHFKFKEDTRKYKEQKEALLKSEDPVFHEEINEQYRDLVHEMMVDEISKQFAFPVENVIIALEGVNLDAYV